MQHEPRSGELWIAGGGAKRNPRIKAEQIRNPGRVTSDNVVNDLVSPLQGSFLCYTVTRGFRFAPPPAILNPPLRGLKQKSKWHWARRRRSQGPAKRQSKDNGLPVTGCSIQHRWPRTVHLRSFGKPSAELLNNYEKYSCFRCETGENAHT
jgi:hypothetical protein